MGRRRGGCFFSKRSRGMLQAERPYMMAVEDPNEPTNDLAKGSYNIQKVCRVWAPAARRAHPVHASQRLAPAQVRGAFDFAYQQLAAPCDVGESLLERLIRCASSGAAVACQQSCALPGRVAHRRGWPGWTSC